MPDTKRTATGVLGGIAGLVGLSVVAGVLVAATVTPAIAISGAAASSAITMFDNLPKVLEIEKLMLPTTLYYKNPEGVDVELASFYDQNRTMVTFDEVSPVMYDAILSSEDPRFYQHGGIDLIGTTRALLQNFKGGGETQGGSSISQQYVKNILIQKCESNAGDEARDQLNKAAEKTAEEVAAQTTKDTGTETAPVVIAPTIDEIIAKTDAVLANCWTQATTADGNEGIQRKLQEMRYSIALEQKYSKNEILLGYLNTANFGGQTYGIEAAANRYFNVSAKDLTVSQAATLAGIVQNPNTYRIDKPAGSIFGNDGATYNKAPDSVIDDINKGQLAALDTLLAAGTITQEQYVAAADGYSATKGRQLYVLSRLLDDGKITQEQYTAAVIEPITPVLQPMSKGCADAGDNAYFCQYVKSVIKSDPAFGATQEDRDKALQRGGLNVYTTLDLRVQAAAVASMRANVPSSVDFMKLGSAITSVEADTGRVLAIAQNTYFSEDADALAADPNLNAIVFAGDMAHGASGGFLAGSTFKLFTLIDWLEQGHSLKESVNGRVHQITKIKDSCNASGWWIDPGAKAINNFGGGGGSVGTPLSFTTSSLNSGYLSMGEKLDLCDIQKVATKMGVTLAKNGDPVSMNGAFSILGSNAVSPIAMAGAYATVANNGIYCQPKVIDSVTDSDGNAIVPPATKCEQVIDPKVAATAAYALETVMGGGGTGRAANPRDGIAVLGKTGTAEELQTWMVESSTKVATAAWVGNYVGDANVYRPFGNLRYELARDTQAAANAVYGGNDFPGPDSDLMRQVQVDLPSVLGMSVDQATQVLQEAGFEVTVGEPVDSGEAEGIVVAQNPGAGKVSSASTITINASNGQGVSVPDVTGRQLDKAIDDLRSAGFGNVVPGTCTADANADVKRIVTSTNPAATTVTNRNAAISVNYTTKICL